MIDSGDLVRPMNQPSGRCKRAIAKLFEDDARGKARCRAEAIIAFLIAASVFTFIASCHGCFHR